MWMLHSSIVISSPIIRLIGIDKLVDEDAKIKTHNNTI
jgi:hypothetical protein